MGVGNIIHSPVKWDHLTGEWITHSEKRKSLRDDKNLKSSIKKETELSHSLLLLLIESKAKKELWLSKLKSKRNARFSNKILYI